MLLEEGKIAAGDVARALKNREKMIKDLREKLAAGDVGAAGGPQARHRRAQGRPPRSTRARKAITRAQRAARQAQGRYMAAVRRLSDDARVKVREIRKESGVDAAIKAAMKMASAK